MSTVSIGFFGISAGFVKKATALCAPKAVGNNPKKMISGRDPTALQHSPPSTKQPGKQARFAFAFPA